MVANIIRLVVDAGCKPAENRIFGKLGNIEPQHGWNVQSVCAQGQSDRRSFKSVIHRHGTGASHHQEKLVLGVMGMSPTARAGQDVIEKEDPADLKWDMVVLLRKTQGPAVVRPAGQANKTVPWDSYGGRHKSRASKRGRHIAGRSNFCSPLP